MEMLESVEKRGRRDVAAHSDYDNVLEDRCHCYVES